MPCHRGIKCSTDIPLHLVKSFVLWVPVWLKIAQGFTLLILPIIGHSEKACQPCSSVCANELYMGSIKTLNCWFLRNLPATTAAWLPLWACLLKQQHLWLRLRSYVHSDHRKPASHRAIFSSISSLWRATSQLPISSHGSEMHYSN